MLKYIASPNHLELEITVKEIPTGESMIPNDTFIIPEDKLESEADRIAREAKNKK